MAIPKLNFTVSEAQTKAFANAWDSGGIKIILDNTSIKFACDWANIVLKSFVADMAAQVAKVAEAKLAAQKTAQAAPGGETIAPQAVGVPAPAAPSRITLTD